jgi:hypothetical protein
VQFAFKTPSYSRNEFISPRGEDHVTANGDILINL